jgi:threonine/homoserine/homoserine lactone efflux protein
MPSTDLNTVATLFSVAGLWTVAVITPGPNFFLNVRPAMAWSRTAALWNVLGIACGAVVWGLCGFFGLSLIFHAAPWLHGTLRVFGGGYLVYLGFKLVHKRVGVSTDDDLRPFSSVSALTAWRSGLLTNLSNPKTAAFVTSLFAARMPAAAASWLGLASVALMTMLAITWYTAVAYLFSAPRCAGLYQRGQHWIDRFAGMVFMAFEARLVVSR